MADVFHISVLFFAVNVSYEELFLFDYKVVPGFFVVLVPATILYV